ncbi:MAG: cation diffusion facilitator family transporter [Mobilicoccus sp.]|nr:cation diffusion facilitator family transporter [Mobilicoccus sp.]
MSSDHDHHAGASVRRLAIAFGLVALVLVAQIIGTVITGSLALLTDTVHAAVDSVGLLVALVAAGLMTRPASGRRTWGYARVEVVAALGQAALLLVVSVYALVEGIGRLLEPVRVPGPELLFFGVVGLVANIVALVVLAGGRRDNLNLRAAFLEVLNDALGSLGVVVAAIVITTTGYQRADTLAALFIAALIVPRAVVLLRAALRILLEFAPSGVDTDEVREHVLALEHVRDVHDLHASSVASGLPVLTMHVVLDDGCFESGHAPDILGSIRACVREHFAVSFEHVTIQLETEELHRQEAPVHHS